VREAVAHTPPLRVLCTVSSPFEEGRAFSEDLRATGLEVELVEDADAVSALDRASLLLIGADTVFRDGAVCNKVGTRPLAETATRLGVRTVVACEVIKLAPIDAPDGIDDEHFDMTSAEYVDEIVTEEGAFPSDEIGALVDRTPFLGEGYAILRAG
jgi:translation initiation factor 2B subunit (eIF-2B alpha/beta/delta family)